MKENRKLKRKSYFVIEAIKIIEKEGLGHLTTRAVANAAGFNQASIYSYFDNMDHLENTASIYFTEEYAKALTFYTDNVTSGIQSYLIMWELFLYYALKDPYLYYNVFYSSIAQDGKHNLFHEYYELFPESKYSESFMKDMIQMDRTQNRNRFVLNKCIEENSITTEMVDYISEVHVGYTKCIFTDIVKSNLYEPSPELFRKCMRYIIYSMLHYIAPDHLDIVNEYLDFYKQDQDDYELLCWRKHKPMN